MKQKKLISYCYIANSIYNYREKMEIKKRILESNRLNEVLLLTVSSVSCFGLSIFRYIYSDTKAYLFLNWNLFLAFLPWLLSFSIILFPKVKDNKIFLTCLLLSWVAFFPNAPYILTDLFHLKLQSNVPIWFDLMLILSFAWTGLLFGFISLFQIENLFSFKLNPRYISAFSIMFLFISGFGVYIGRFLRWNSWDILTNPIQLFNDILHRFINPFQHPRTWGMTILMGLFLTFVYFTLKYFQKSNENRTLSDIKV